MWSWQRGVCCRPLLGRGSAECVVCRCVLLAAAFVNSGLTFEKNLRSVSRADSQRLGILRKFRRVFLMMDCFWRDAFGILSCQFGVLLSSVVLGCRYTPKTTGPCKLTDACLSVTLQNVYLCQY